MSDEPFERRSDDDWPRSYLRRQGHITRAQKRALRELWPDYGLTFQYGELLDLDAAFGRRAPRALELGFGMGEQLIALAQSDAGRDVLGIEMHRPGLGAAIARADELGLRNLRALRGDALFVLADYLRGPQFDTIGLFFPTPWHDRPERRLVRDVFLEHLEGVCHQGARFYLCTDVPDYAAHAREVFARRPAWRQLPAPEARPAWRVVTKYEARAVREGRPVLDLAYRFDP